MLLVKIVVEHLPATFFLSFFILSTSSTTATHYQTRRTEWAPGLFLKIKFQVPLVNLCRSKPFFLPHS